MKEPEMEKVGDFIAEVVRAPEDAAVHESVRGKVRELCERFPLYDPLM
jgi:glycine hydroxymethyltransferase